MGSSTSSRSSSPPATLGAGKRLFDGFGRSPEPRATQSTPVLNTAGSVDRPAIIHPSGSGHGLVAGDLMVGGSSGGVEAPGGGGPAHDAGRDLFQPPSLGLFGAMVVTAQRVLPAFSASAPIGSRKKAARLSYSAGVRSCPCYLASARQYCAYRRDNAAICRRPKPETSPGALALESRR